MILPQNSSVTPPGQKCKHGSFCSIFHKLSEYSNLEITPWDEHGLLVIQRTNSFTDFRTKDTWFLGRISFPNIFENPHISFPNLFTISIPKILTLFNTCHFRTIYLDYKV
jgi:hypothetical protein